MEKEIEKKIKNLKEFIKQKTNQGTSNYLGKEIREICGMVETLALSQLAVSNSIAIQYAEFCVRCDREKLPLLCLEDYIKQYCC